MGTGGGIPKVAGKAGEIRKKIQKHCVRFCNGKAQRGGNRD